MIESTAEFLVAAQIELREMVRTGVSSIVQRARHAPAAWHPNGFVVFTLGAHPLGNLRLHIWPAMHRKLRGAEANVHTHVWDLCSTVLSGTYGERIFHVVGDTEGEEVHAAEIDYLRDPDVLTAVGTTSLQSAAVRTFGRGELHMVPAGIAHETIIPLDRYASTLLLTSKARIERVKVFSRTPLVSGRRPRLAVGEDLRSRLLDELQARVEEGR